MALALNFYAIELQVLSLDYLDGRTRRSLVPLGRGIRDCLQAIDRAKASGDEEYRDAVVDSETELIETHLGSAFVTCQTFITTAVSRIKSLHKYHKRHTGASLASTGESKADILSFGSPKVRRSAFTRVQVIDALANYFKHRDEWHGTWNRFTGGTARTALIIEAAGAEQGSSGNLRAGARALGNRSFQDVGVFASILDAWMQELWAAYRKEFRQKGLV